MKGRPFFSILIPTKGRPHCVPYAVRSVLRQTFKDFEIVLVDNDDSEATREVVACFQDDHRFRYFRTGGLSMLDNWEYARRQARGNFITVLEDKQAYYPNSLEIIYKVINRSKCDLVGWLPDRIKPDVSDKVIRPQDMSGRILYYDPSHFLRRLFNSFGRMHIRLPRMINSCASMSAIERTVTLLGEDRLFLPVNPDFTSGYALLGQVNEYVFIDTSLVVTNTSESLSAGQRAMRSEKFSEESLRDIGMRKEDVYEFVPLKHLLVVNSMINDYYRVKRKCPVLPDISINFKEYVELCWRECTSRDFASYKMVSRCLRDIYQYDKGLYLKGWVRWMAINLYRYLPRKRKDAQEHDMIERVVLDKELMPSLSI